MENSAFKLSVEQTGIAHLVFDLPGEKVNTLSLPILIQLEKQLDAAAANKEIKILAISSGKEGTFMAGADLHSFAPFFRDPARADELLHTGHRVFSKLSQLPFPTVAVIEGTCLGGGMELALGCTYRLASDHPKTSLGLPEVSLGIIPGWGGTQRLPRLVGLVEGLSMILAGSVIKAPKAYKIKLIDALVASEFLEASTEDFLKFCLTPAGKKQLEARRKLQGARHFLLESNPLGRRLVFYQAEKNVLKKTKGHYPAPLIALEVIKETYTLPLQTGLAKEIEVFRKNLSTGFSNARNLISLFFTQEALKKDFGGSPHKIETVGVVGAGTMGSGIAWAFSNRDIPVRLKDINWNAVSKGWGAVYALYKKRIKEKKLRESEASLKFHQLTGTIDYSGFKKLDLVVEAAVESLDLKHQILRDLEASMRPEAIIATNTSSLTLAEMGTVLNHPERFVGMHFFNPVNRMPLVEVVASHKTSPEVVTTAVEICRKLGKTPIVVGDCPGFLVNRIFAIGLNEVVLMYQEGADFQRLEKMMLDFGMPMSPFLLADEVGNDVAYKVTCVFEKAYGIRMAMPKLMAVMEEHKLYGKKCGQGFYLYDGNSSKPNPKVPQLRDQLGLNTKSFVNEDMQDRVFLGMINEAARCLEEKVIENPAYLDMALIMGIGFPLFRGGLLRYADTLGIEYIVKQLKRFQEQYGERFKPAERLLEMQRTQRSFFA